MKQLITNLKNFNPKTLIPSAKGVARGTYLVNIAIAFAVFIALNFVFKQITFRYDLTSNKQYSLSDETRRVLRDIKDEVNVVAFVDNFTRGDAERLLREYELSQPKIKVEYVDYRSEIVRVRQEQILKAGTVVFRSGEAKEVANVATETEFTSALYKVLNPRQYNVVAWTGSGQRSLQDPSLEFGMSGIGVYLTNNNFQVTSKNEVNDPSIPEDTDVLLIAGTRSTIPTTAAEELSKFVDRGGKLFVALDPKDAGMSYGIEHVISRFGVEVQNGLVFEPRNSFNNQPPLFAVLDFPSSQITESLRQVRFFLSGAIAITDPAPQGVMVTSIVQSSSDAWLEQSLNENVAPVRDGNDPVGPLNIAVTSVLDLGGDRSARMVLFADADFPVNLFLDSQSELYNTDNIDLFINSMNWLVARDNLYNIAPKERVESRVSLNDQQSRYVTLGVLAVMPLIFLMSGFVVMKRRKR